MVGVLISCGCGLELEQPFFWEDVASLRKKLTLFLLVLLFSQILIFPFLIKPARGDVITDVEDAVDNDTSDVDASPDLGSSSNFADQQSGPDSTYDTLTEAGTGSVQDDYVDSDASDIDSSPD